MLDDLKYIHERDAQDALGIAEKQSEQYKHDFQVSAVEARPQAIAVAGMGGSALAAVALQSVPGLPVPMEVIRDYNLPERIGQQWLLVCSSYSGNTEETISALQQALAMPAESRPTIVCISSGGKLQELAGQNQLVHIALPIGYQPRHTFGYQYAALVQLMEAVGLLSGYRQTLETAASVVAQAVANWRPDVATDKNQAKQLALEIMGKSAVVYASHQLFPAAYKWKISFNENAKNVAWCNEYPEFNHNEFLGWTSHPTDKPYAVIDLRSQHDHPQTQKRFELSARLLSGKRPAPLVVDIPKGANYLEDMLWAVALGDFVSLYVALLNGLNPTPVDLIERFKKELV